LAQVNFSRRLKANTSSFYEITDSSQDQEPLVRVILSKVKEWIELNRINDIDKMQNFNPLCLTVRGMAGSGKSFVINIVCTALMRVFGRNDSITSEERRCTELQVLM
jgi:pantothenate kinase-related protein Tda10